MRLNSRQSLRREFPSLILSSPFSLLSGKLALPLLVELLWTNTHPFGAYLSLLVEVVGIEPTSYSAAKKLSTYGVYLLFLNFRTRVNTLYKTQKAEYSLKNTFRFQKEFSVFLTPRPQPTDKSGATIVLKKRVTLQERSLHFYLHLNLSGTFYRSRSVYGMLILSLTGNRIRCTPKGYNNCIIIITARPQKVNYFFAFSHFFIDGAKNISAAPRRVLRLQ